MISAIGNDDLVPSSIRLISDSSQHSMILMARSLRFTSSLLLTILIATWFSPSPVFAQDVSGSCAGWPTLQPLFVNPDLTQVIDNLGTSLVVDERGQAHLAWLSHPSQTTDGSQDVYFYSRWDRQSWTQPVDIFATGQQIRLGWPLLVPEPGGKLHIFWSAGNYILHSWAWAEQADSAQAWTEPEAVITTTETNSAPIDVKLDSQGVFHLVFTTRIGDVQYVHSRDGGLGWSDPVPVSQVPPNVTTFLPRIAIAPQSGIKHVIWTELRLPNGPSLRVNYARSTDGGATWTNQLELGGQFASDGNVLATDDGLVYVAWNGGVGLGGRYLKWSKDAGVTWSDTLRFSDRVGQASFPSLALDSTNTLHMLTGDGEYSNWNQRNLSLACAFAPPETERSRLVVVTGNQILIVIPKASGHTVDYAVENLPIAAVPTVMSLPISATKKISITESPVLSATQIAPNSEQASIVPMFDRTEKPLPRNSLSLPIGIATLASGLVVLLIISAYIRSRRF